MTGYFLDLSLFFGGQLWRGAGENVEDGQFLFRQVFPDMALLLIVQASAQRDKVTKQLFDIQARLQVSAAWYYRRSK